MRPSSIPVAAWLRKRIAANGHWLLLLLQQQLLLLLLLRRKLLLHGRLNLPHIRRPSQLVLLLVQRLLLQVLLLRLQQRLLLLKHYVLRMLLQLLVHLLGHLKLLRPGALRWQLLQRLLPSLRPCELLEMH